MGVPEEDGWKVNNKMGRILVAVVVVPEEDRTWFENEMGRRLVAAAVWIDRRWRTRRVW